MFEKGVVGVMHRTTDEWLAHPEGAHLAETDLIEINKIGETDPVAWTADPTQPLSGIRVLALTHVIAGSTAARTLSEYGAEALHVMRDQSFEHEGLWTDVNIGMRSTTLDLNRPDHSAALSAQVPDADVFIDSFSGRGIERRGFGIDEVVAKRPGIVYLTLRGYSWDGPWKDVRTFDMEAVSTTGFTIAEGSGGTPGFGPSYGYPESGDAPLPAFPPTRVLNDYLAGYRAAAGVIAGLRRRAAEGGSYHVHVNLARAAMWYASLGMFPSTDFEVTDRNRMIEPETFAFDPPYDAVQRLAPMAKLSRTPGRWQDPLLPVRGADRPVWKDAL
jgi:crotonobetainyl-CoA:carnitine CoA-transferase CaiB-like acyl-CoA transferase